MASLPLQSLAEYSRFVAETLQHPCVLHSTVRVWSDNTSEVLFRLCANTDPQRDSLFTKGPSDVLDHATSEIALPREIRAWRGDSCESWLDDLTGRGSKLGMDATKKLPGEGFKCPWPPLIKMDESVKAEVEKLFALSR